MAGHSGSPQPRAGLPAAASVFAEASFHAPTGTQYRIIATNERDPNDSPALTATVPSARTAAFAAAGGDNFAGTARRVAKLSIAQAPVEAFGDVRDLIAALPGDAAMRNHHPPITDAATSNRVAEEKRNIRLRAFLYAASRENDNDFHLIIGRAAHSLPETYMTIEISGLPVHNAASFARLKVARDAFKHFFGTHLPGGTYDFYDPPIPVEIEGSMLWDASHSHGGRPGPQSLRPHMPVLWEIHPVTRIVFEPHHAGPHA